MTNTNKALLGGLAATAVIGSFTYWYQTPDPVLIPIATVTTTSVETKTPVYLRGPGDVNGDGAWDQEDFLWYKSMYQHGCMQEGVDCCAEEPIYCNHDMVIGPDTLREYGPQDITGDGKFTYTDVLYMNYCLGPKDHNGERYNKFYRPDCYTWLESKTDTGTSGFIVIRGRVVDENGNGVEGVTVTAGP